MSKSQSLKEKKCQKVDRIVQGIKVVVSVFRNYFTDMCHLEYDSENRAPTWISETGFRSQFLYEADVKDMTTEEIVDFGIQELQAEKGVAVDTEQQGLGAWC